MQDLKDFDKDNIPKPTLQKLAKYIADPVMAVDNVTKARVCLECSRPSIPHLLTGRTGVQGRVVPLHVGARNGCVQQGREGSGAEASAVERNERPTRLCQRTAAPETKRASGTSFIGVVLCGRVRVRDCMLGV